MVAHAWISSTWKSEAGGSACVCSYPGLRTGNMAQSIGAHLTQLLASQKVGTMTQAYSLSTKVVEPEEWRSSRSLQAVRARQ